MAEMMPLTLPTKVLITVKTYPQPSQKYRETVCTAGITEAGEWVRLYPVPFRYLSRVSHYRKYQWVAVQLGERGASGDPRPESHRPNLESIQLCGEPLTTARKWAERRAVIDPMPHYTLNQLRDLYQRNRTSLGIVRPTRIIDVEYEPETEKWKPRIQRLFDQMPLFGEGQKSLRKLPYRFRYVFECSDSAKPHKAQIVDWELGALFNKEAVRLKSDKEAAESVRHKFLNGLCREDLDTRFFMGTRLPYNTWMVLGVFYPERQLPTWKMQRLF